jgi:hypothetical protein
MTHPEHLVHMRSDGRNLAKRARKIPPVKKMSTKDETERSWLSKLSQSKHDMYQL